MYFIITYQPQLKVTLARLVERKPKSTDKDGFELRYIAALDPAGHIGAQLSIEKLDAYFGSRCKGAGVYQAPYDEVRAQLEAILSDAPQARRTHIILRVLAGLTAAALTVAMGFCVVGGTIFWLAVCAFKKQSGLMAMAETAVIAQVLDWRPLIRRLVRIALGQ